MERIESQEEFIVTILGMAVSKEDYVILVNNYTMPTLFGFARDYFSFLMTIGNSKELKQLQTLSSLE
jgi:hypothetical protein